MTMRRAFSTLAAPSQVRGALRRGRKAGKRVAAYASHLYFRCRNLLSGAAATGTAPVVVSVTTHGNRIHKVGVALESIAAGRARPQRLILWLDSAELMATRPAAVRRLERRGLEVLLAPNYGPHTKYYPYVVRANHHMFPLVTADDDIIYPRAWLEGLVEANRTYPEAINAYWVNVIQVSQGRVAPYIRWPRARNTDPASGRNFALGVSGVIYPPAMLEELKRQGEVFLTAAPGADDIWLHRTALRARIPVRQIHARPRHFPIIPGSQGESLMSENVGRHQNDIFINGLYTAEDVLAIVNTGDDQLLK